jgi:hypothetical protein
VQRAEVSGTIAERDFFYRFKARLFDNKGNTMFHPKSSGQSGFFPRGVADQRRIWWVASWLVMLVAGPLGGVESWAAQLKAGAAKIDISRVESGPLESPLFAKALVIKSDATTVVLVTLDVVSFGEIGHIPNDFIEKVRARAEKELGLKSKQIMFNASHCHGAPCKDVEERTFQVIKRAVAKLVPVRVGVGVGQEDRIMENRRMFLKSGKEIDVRQAYSLPPDEEVVGVGPVDTEIGILRLDREDGRPLALVYNFAVHPIQGVPSGNQTADMTGFSSQVIEDNLDQGAIAFFIQGCGGDINPIGYKNVDRPPNAEALGNMLGLSTLKSLRTIKTKADSRLAVINETIELPRANFAPRIAELETRLQVLVKSLRGTTLNLRTFMQLSAKHNIASEHPSYHISRYLHDEKMGKSELKTLDARNRSAMKAYIRNIYTMEEITRLQTNLRLLKKNQQKNLDAEKRTIDVEVAGIRIGDFLLITFPGELTVRIGLRIKKRTKHEHTFVAGYTNGYIYYSPTNEQMRNVGGAQEDSDCILGPGWLELFDKKVDELVQRLK